MRENKPNTAYNDIFFEKLFEVAQTENVSRIAREMDISQSALNKMKNNQQALSVDILTKAAKKYSCSTDYLLGIDSENKAISNECDYDIKGGIENIRNLIEEHNKKAPLYGFPAVKDAIKLIYALAEKGIIDIVEIENDSISQKQNANSCVFLKNGERKEYSSTAIIPFLSSSIYYSKLSNCINDFFSIFQLVSSGILKKDVLETWIEGIEKNCVFPFDYVDDYSMSLSRENEEIFAYEALYDEEDPVYFNIDGYAFELTENCDYIKLTRKTKEGVILFQDIEGYENDYFVDTDRNKYIWDDEKEDYIKQDKKKIAEVSAPD